MSLFLKKAINPENEDWESKFKSVIGEIRRTIVGLHSDKNQEQREKLLLSLGGDRGRSVVFSHDAPEYFERLFTGSVVRK